MSQPPPASTERRFTTSAKNARTFAASGEKTIACMPVIMVSSLAAAFAALRPQPAARPPPVTGAPSAGNLAAAGQPGDCYGEFSSSVVGRPGCPPVTQVIEAGQPGVQPYVGVARDCLAPGALQPPVGVAGRDEEVAVAVAGQDQWLDGDGHQRAQGEEFLW